MKTPGAVFVAAGILLSRLAGLVRLRVFAHYFGLQSDAADAFNAAFRIPNFLQNLFGEGALSASFIPVYASLLGRGRQAEADQVAGAVGAILALVVAVLVLTGLVATPLLIGALAPGFAGEKRELTIQGTYYTNCPHPVSWRRIVGLVCLVSRRPEQSSALSPVICGTDHVERRDDCHPVVVRRSQ
jgi:peptidoglycan biosynthesis protein MviN/MurJ (putative lipid II flippase)